MRQCMGAVDIWEDLLKKKMDFAGKRKTYGEIERVLDRGF